MNVDSTRATSADGRKLVVTFWQTAVVVLKYSTLALTSPPAILRQTQLEGNTRGAAGGERGWRRSAKVSALYCSRFVQVCFCLDVTHGELTSFPPRPHPFLTLWGAQNYLVRASMLSAVFSSHGRQRARLSPVMALKVPSGQSWHGARGTAVVMADAWPRVGSAGQNRPVTRGKGGMVSEKRG